jgi:hypothetical protein
MRRATVRRGEIVRWERPNWRPLEKLVGELVVGDFMWMFEVRLTDGSLLQAYKHIDTRRYVHLDEAGAAFAYEEPHRYRPVSRMSRSGRRGPRLIGFLPMRCSGRAW